VDGGPVATLVTGQDGPETIVAIGPHIYWANYGGIIARATIETGAHSVIASGQPNPGGIAVDLSFAYWTTKIGHGSIMVAPLYGGAATALVSNQPNPAAITVDDGDVYWINAGTNNENGSVMRFSALAGITTTIAANQHRPVSIAVVGTAIYWTTLGANDHDGSIFRSIPTLQKSERGEDTRTTIILASHQWRPNAIAADATHVYWTNLAEGSVMKVSSQGGSHVLLACAQKSPHALGLDSTSVYWTNDDGTIVKVAK
jgi:DNA-binding beta-propeller fold protein YncE